MILEQPLKTKLIPRDIKIDSLIQNEYDITCQQAGAELCQAQVKLEVILEVGMEFGDEVEACHY